MHRLCVGSLELLAHKTRSVHHTQVVMHSRHFLKDANAGESSPLPASSGALSQTEIFLDTAERIDRSDLTKCVDDMVRCVYVNTC